MHTNTLFTTASPQVYWLAPDMMVSQHQWMPFSTQSTSAIDSSNPHAWQMQITSWSTASTAKLLPRPKNTIPFAQPIPHFAEHNCSAGSTAFHSWPILQHDGYSQQIPTHGPVATNDCYEEFSSILSIQPTATSSIPKTPTALQHNALSTRHHTNPLAPSHQH